MRQCVERGVLDPHAQAPLLSLCVDARRNSSDMMDRSLFDVPFAYAHVVTVLVKFTILFSAVHELVFLPCKRRTLDYFSFPLFGLFLKTSGTAPLAVL